MAVNYKYRILYRWALVDTHKNLIKWCEYVSKYDGLFHADLKFIIKYLIRKENEHDT